MSSDGLPVDRPTREQLREWRRVTSPPKNEVPTPVALGTVLGRADGVYVAITTLHVYSTGLSLVVDVWLRHDVDAALPRPLHEVVGWAGGPSARNGLLLGVEYADGRSATTVGDGQPWWHQDDLGSPDARPSLDMTFGGGGPHRYSQRMWLYPVPPPGPLTVVCVWPAFAIAETQTVLDGAALAEAAARAVVLWPPAPDVEPEEPVPPQVPPGGWFADRVGRLGDA